MKKLIQDFFMSSGKRKREDFPSQYRPGGYIPQQDGAGDVLSDVLKVNFFILSHNPSNGYSVAVPLHHCQQYLEIESLQVSLL